MEGREYKGLIVRVENQMKGRYKIDNNLLKDGTLMTNLYKEGGSNVEILINIKGKLREIK